MMLLKPELETRHPCLLCSHHAVTDGNDATITMIALPVRYYWSLGFARESFKNKQQDVVADDGENSTPVITTGPDTEPPGK